MARSEPGAAERPRRRRLQRAVTELHYRLRTENDTPARLGLAIGLGTFVGCLPVWGAHLLLCVGLAALLGLSRLNTYLAAHVNNPLTAPLLLYGGWGIGHYMFRGTWPALDAATITGLSPWGFGRDLFAGSLVLGVLLGGSLGAIAYGVSRRAQHAPPTARLFEEVSRLYVECGVFHWEFAHGKLWHDPLYAALAGRIAKVHGTLLDLGCGRGIALALAATARRLAGPGESVPQLELIGVERDATLAGVARTALGGRARIEVADLARHELPPADVILLLDVLHYLDGAAQERLLARSAAALRPGGRLLLREADAAAGPRFWITRAAERAAALARGAWRQRFRYRGARRWSALLAAHGLESEVVPPARWTPFANVLLEARRRGAL